MIASQSRAGSYGSNAKDRASLSSLKESGDLEYSADSVSILTKSDDDDFGPLEGIAPVEIATQRATSLGGSRRQP